jgi:hypothetical protein
VLGQSGEVAQVREQHGDDAFRAQGWRRAEAQQLARRQGGVQQRRHRHRPERAELAGEPHTGPGADPAEHPQFIRPRRWQRA